MTCARAREQIIKLDAHEAPSPRLARHLDACSECRRVHDGLRRLEADARLVSPQAAEMASTLDAAFTAKVMHAVHETRANTTAVEPAVGLRGWTVGGAVILAGLVAIQFSEVVDWLRGSLGPIIDVALATMFGVALTIYILILVGSNLTVVRRALRWLTG